MQQIEHLLKKIEERSYTIGIVGLGYVGLPLMWTFHKNGMPVLGFDIDKNKVENLKKGIPYIKHLGKEMMEILANSKNVDVTTDFSRLDEVDAILLCVPTPLNHHREPDMSYVVTTTETISKFLKREQLVVLESTTWPGTTEELMVPILEEASGLKAGNDFYVAYSPEREDPGNVNFNTAKIPKVVGGYGDESLELAAAVYSTSIIKTVKVSSTKAAEAVKLTENIFRSVNIALVNELKVIYDSMNIDVHEVLDAADTKPFGFMKFTPGPGLGGHCIPIDPFYLTWKAREFEKHTRFIELAGEINTHMPYYVVDRISYALNIHKKAMNGSRILVVGLAYKPDVDDMRESPAFKIFDILKEKGSVVCYYDPFIPEVLPTREHAEWTGTKSVEWSENVISSFDVIVICTDHSSIDYAELAQWGKCIVDTRNAMSEISSKQENHIFKA